MSSSIWANLRYYTSAILLVTVSPVYLLIWTIFQLLARLLGKNYAILFDDIMYASYQKYLLFFFEILSGVKVKISGDYEEISTKKENVIIFSNHQCLVDWIVMAMLAERQGSSSNTRFVLKHSLKYLPLYGFYFKQHGYLYVERSGYFRKDKFVDQLNQLSLHPYTVWLALFPEGHRFNPEKIQSLNKMRQYAKDNDLPLYENLLTPRVKAFAHCVKELKSKMDAIYDVTMTFSTTLPSEPVAGGLNRFAAPSYYDMFKKDMTINIHVTRIPMSQVPDVVGADSTAFEEWVYSRYEVKDRMLSDFYSPSSPTRGILGKNGKPSKLSRSRIIPVVVVYIACLLPWFLSWAAFFNYLTLLVATCVFTVFYSMFFI